MNPMHEALKRHILKAKSGTAHPSAGSPQQDDTEVAGDKGIPGSKEGEMNDDRAPQIAAPPGKDGGVVQNPLASGHDQLNDEHAAVLHAIMQDTSNHPGRGPMSFDERAGASMKEKMASIKKEKEGKV